MKVLPFKIPKPENNALIFQIDHADAFYNKLHQHEEIQISFILEGDGDLVVGDTINRYGKDDIVVIGGNVPHLFRSDESSGTPSHMLTLFFEKESFGKVFFELIELKELESFFRKAQSGMRLLENTAEVKAIFLQLENASGLDRFIYFLKILGYFSKSKTETLSSFISQKIYSEDEGERMSKVMNHAMSAFDTNITLEEISGIASMSPNAFCRYFKERTNKTFFQFLTEIRLEHACRLLQKNPDLSILEISELSGFRNLSHFNRKFRRYKGITPTAYRKK